MRTLQETRTLSDRFFSERPEAWAHCETVEYRRDLPFDEFVREYVEKKKPVVIKGGVRTDAVTPSVLRQCCGHKPLAQMMGGGGSTVLVRGKSSAIENFKSLTTFGDYLSHFEEDTADLPYLTNLDIRRNFDEISDRFKPPHYFQPNWTPLWSDSNYSGVEAFIAPAHTMYGVLHFDRHGVFVASCQYYGKKMWWICPREEEKYLYLANPVDKVWGSYPHISQVNPFNPDLETFPLFARVKARVVTLEAGDILFVPTWWWHATKAVTPNISTVHRLLNKHNLPSYLWDLRVAFARHPSLLARGLKRMAMGK
jgi:hypothetical protein